MIDDALQSLVERYTAILTTLDETQMLLMHAPHEWEGSDLDEELVTLLTAVDRIRSEMAEPELLVLHADRNRLREHFALAGDEEAVEEAIERLAGRMRQYGHDEDEAQAFAERRVSDARADRMMGGLRFGAALDALATDPSATGRLDEELAAVERRVHTLERSVTDYVVARRAAADQRVRETRDAEASLPDELRELHQLARVCNMGFGAANEAATRFKATVHEIDGSGDLSIIDDAILTAVRRIERGWEARQMLAIILGDDEDRAAILQRMADEPDSEATVAEAAEEAGADRAEIALLVDDHRWRSELDGRLRGMMAVRDDVEFFALAMKPELEEWIEQLRADRELLESETIRLRVRIDGAEA